MNCQLSDRELDLYIAEKIMSWEVQRNPQLPAPHDMIILGPAGWRPTTDLNVCREVENKMNNKQRKLYESIVWSEARSHFNDEKQARFYMLSLPARPRCDMICAVLENIDKYPDEIIGGCQDGAESSGVVL